MVLYSLSLSLLDGTWNLENPTIVCLGVKSILALTEAGKKLWCACGSQIIILDALTLGIEVTMYTFTCV